MNAYEQKLQQFALIQSIRESLPAGYSASSWDAQICIQYTPANHNPDNRKRWFVQDERSWVVLKATLGLL